MVYFNCVILTIVIVEGDLNCKEDDDEKQLRGLELFKRGVEAPWRK